MGQNFTDFKTSSKDRHIKHWTPYHVNDQRVYVVDFNYLLNGMQVLLPSVCLSVWSRSS